jgi:omega-6 fatty acid desaturase (delta-12 desaturase)
MTALAADMPSRTAMEWVRTLSRYQTPSVPRAIGEIAITVIPFIACWYGMYWGLSSGHLFVYFLLMLPTVGFFVRMFLIQHDCGHGSFFRNRAANDWVGRFLGVLTLTPYDHWRRAHAIHHATSGNLSRRGVGDIDTLTVSEYRARSIAKRRLYRLYRNPLIMFGIGPFFVFILQNRIPAGFLRAGWRPWISALAAGIGGWLFYVQHQFSTTTWDESRSWSVREAALHGSSHYDLPPVLRWFSANIGVHHVHHLCSRIPFYRLQSVLTSFPELRTTGRLTLWDSLKCVRLVLWDADRRELVSFRDEARQAAA